MSSHEIAASTAKDLDAPKSRIETFLDDISDQNNRCDLARELGNETLRRVVEDGVGDEQLVSFDNLLSASAAVPYDEVRARYSSIENELGVARALADAAMARLAEDYEKARELAVNRSDELASVYEAEKKWLEQTLLEDVVHRHDSARTIYDEYAKPWPIPRAIPPAERSELYSKQLTLSDTPAVQYAQEIDTPSSIEIVDTIPVVPQSSEIAERAVGEIRKYKIENPSLTADVIEYITCKLGETVTVEDLVAYCYGNKALEDEDRRLLLRSRITVALGPKGNGRKVHDVLGSEGLQLQYGERRIYEMLPDGTRGKQTTRYSRIYRVVPANHSLGDEGYSQGIDRATIDTWNSNEETEAVFIAVHLAQQALNECQQKFESERNSALAFGEGATIDEGLSSAEIDHAWKQEIVAATEKVIEQMIEDRMFYEGGENLPIGVVRTNDSSRVFSARTILEQLCDAGIVRNGKKNSSSNISFLTRNQIVCAYLLDSFPQLANKRNKKDQREALRLVDTVIQSHLSKLATSTHSGSL